MGRPKEFDAEFVLSAATDCFWADGFASTSISSLVAAMQIQRSSFYNSFTSREGILAMVLERYLANSPLNPLIDPSSQSQDVRPDLMLIDLLLDFSHFLAEEGQGRGCLFFNGLSELSPSSGQAYEIYQDYYIRFTAGLSQLIHRIERENTNQELGTLGLDHVLCIMIGMAHFARLDANELRLAKVGLDQLAGLSGHFANLIKQEMRPAAALRQSEEAQRLQA